MESSGVIVSSTSYIFISHREELIDTNIEESVSKMQSVIELARVIRDRKTIPTKYPLREVVVIDTDQQSLDQITSLQKYILEVTL